MAYTGQEGRTRPITHIDEGFHPEKTRWILGVLTHRLTCAFSPPYAGHIND